VANTEAKKVLEAAHGPKKQSTGSQKGNRDQHQQSRPKGPGQGPGPTKNNYKPDKFKSPGNGKK